MTEDYTCTCSAGDKFNDYMVTNAIVTSDGTVLWMYPALIKTYCTLNVKYFPFDSQHCDIQFISWTHNGEQLDIFYNDSMNTAVYYASANQVGQTRESSQKQISYKLNPLSISAVW